MLFRERVHRLTVYTLLEDTSLVKRKGHTWFVSAVLPKLIESHPNLVYLIAGKGGLRIDIAEAAKHHAVDSNVLLLGEVDDFVLRSLYSAADCFVMPNVSVKGDLEGFGIVALEAAVAGLPAVAARVDGIVDAVTDGENGTLVASEDVDGFIDAIERVLQADKQVIGERARQYTLEHFAWPQVARSYWQTFEEVAGLPDRSTA